MPPKKEVKKVHTLPTSVIFSDSDVLTFNEVFKKLSKGENEMNLPKYVTYLREFTKNNKGTIMSQILREMESEGDIDVDFSSFLELLEEKVGDITSSQGLRRIFTFITGRPEDASANLSDLRRIREELGLTISDKDLQKLINFITISYNEKSAFSFEEFQDYTKKTKTN